MSTFYMVTVAIVIAGLALTSIAAIVRIVRGPTILDRMVASDVLLTTLMLSIGADMALRGHTETIPIMVAIGATAVLASIVVARYVKRRAEVDRKKLHSSRGTEHV